MRSGNGLETLGWPGCGLAPPRRRPHAPCLWHMDRVGLCLPLRLCHLLLCSALWLLPRVGLSLRNLAMG